MLGSPLLINMRHGHMDCFLCQPSLCSPSIRWCEPQPTGASNAGKSKKLAEVGRVIQPDEFIGICHLVPPFLRRTGKYMILLDQLLDNT